MTRSSRGTAGMDLRQVDDASVLAVGRVPARTNVLDLGAADASVASVLARMGCRVWAVPEDPVTAAAAASYEDVVVGDLEALDLVDHFGAQRFDVVLMLDLLEHLADPARLLRMVGRTLEQGGWGVISLRSALRVPPDPERPEGRHPRRDAARPDRAPLRLLDRAGIDDLLRDAGWKTFDVARVTRRPATEVPANAPDPEAGRRIEGGEDALTEQLVLCAAPTASPVHEDPPLLPAAIAQDVALAALGAGGSGSGGSGVPDLGARLADIHQESVNRRRQLADLLVALKLDTERLRESLRR